MKNTISALLLMVAAQSSVALDAVSINRGPVSNCDDCKIVIKEVCVGGYVYVVNLTESAMVQKFTSINRSYTPQPERC